MSTLDNKLTDVLDLVRNSCGLAPKLCKFVKIDEENILKFSKEIDIEKITRTQSSIPLKFDKIQEEINFIVLNAILNFGSGYRHLLHKYSGKGAAQTIQYGLISLVLSDNNLDAFALSEISHFDIEQHFKIPYQVEAKHESNPFLRIQVDSELKPLIDKIKHVCNDCGRILRSRKMEDFGQFVLESVKTHGSAEKLVEDFVKTFPAFNDVGKYSDDTPIYFFKKAQLAVGELYQFLKSKDKLFEFKDITKLTIFVDNVIPAVLTKLGILKLDEELEKKIRNKKELKVGVEECELRASSIYACEEIVKLSNGKFTAIDLDYYIWGTIGKEKEFREFERHYTTNTLFY